MTPNLSSLYFRLLPKWPQPLHSHIAARSKLPWLPDHRGQALVSVSPAQEVFPRPLRLHRAVTAQAKDLRDLQAAGRDARRAAMGGAGKEAPEGQKG